MKVEAYFPEAFEFSLPRGRRWKVGPRAAIMGIINVTPDSFSDGGLYSGPQDAVETGLKMLREGADVLDVGGESTRPGSQPVVAEEQLERILPVIEGLRRTTDAPISVDTRAPTVGREAVRAGADIINDVSACRDPGWIPVLKSHDVPVVLMHMRGIPADMQEKTDYPQGVVEEIVTFLKQRMSELEAEGVSRERFIVDPGIGFAKEPHQNLHILRDLPRFRSLGRPLLVGASRKFFLGKLLGRRDGGTTKGDADHGLDSHRRRRRAIGRHAAAAVLTRLHWGATTGLLR